VPEALDRHLLIGRQELQVHFGGLDAGVAQPLLQVIERAAILEPRQRVQMATIVEAERVKIDNLGAGGLGGPVDD
jgi:hypothetical protein